jgi:hypothetical protein
MTTRKLNSHAIAKSASTYIGKAGEIFYDTATATLRLSNGSTTGGITFSGGAPASSLVNGSKTVTLGLDGGVYFPGGSSLGGSTVPNEFALFTMPTNTFSINTSDNINPSHTWTFGTDGNLTLPTGSRLTADNIDVVNLNVSNLNLISPTNYLWLSLYQYYSGSLLTSTFGSISGTAVGTTHPVVGLTQLSTSGRGSGAIFQVTVYYNGSSTTYINVGIYYNGGNQQYGTGYAVGDTVTIAGADLGGTTPANNLTFTIGNAVKNNYPAGLEGGMIYDYSTKHFMVYNGSTWTQLDNPLTPNGTKASNAYGVAGQTSYDANYFYTCIATNTWRRVALGSTY